MDNKLTLDDGHDGALLDGRGTLKTVGVDTTEELCLEVHRVEGVGGLIVVGLDLSCSGQYVSVCSVCWTKRCYAPSTHKPSWPVGS